MPISPLIAYQAGPFSGPFAAVALLADSVIAAQLPYEGLWVPAMFAKSASVQVSGNFTTLSGDVYASNALNPPLNTYTATLGGSETNGDTLTLTFANPLLPGGSAAVPVTAAGGQTINSLATALAAGINANASLAALGFTAMAVGAVITIQWPSVPPGAGAGGTYPSFAQSNTVISKNVSGAATETITIAGGTDGSNITASHLTALGVTALNPMPVRWVKARIGTLTSGAQTASIGLAMSA